MYRDYRRVSYVQRQLSWTRQCYRNVYTFIVYWLTIYYVWQTQSTKGEYIYLIVYILRVADPVNKG